MQHEDRDVVVVLDIGGTATRAARLLGSHVDKVVQCQTPTILMSPDVSIEVLQHQLVELIADLIGSVSRDMPYQPATSPLRVAIAFSGIVDDDERTVLSAPDIWGDVDFRYPLAEEVEKRVVGAANVRVCSDVVAAAWRYGELHAGADETFALLMVRTGLAFAIRRQKQAVHADPVLLGHLPMAEGRTTPDMAGFACTCGSADHLTAYASGTGVVNVIICSALQNPKAFRSSHLFRSAVQRSEHLRFEQRLALLRRHAVLRNAMQLVDEDVWRRMHDRYAEITPGEMQRWVFPVLLDAGMFIDAVAARDEYALQLLDVVTEPVARYLSDTLLDQVDVVAVTGGFARSLGDEYLRRLGESTPSTRIEWAEQDELDDLRGARALLWPSAVSAGEPVDRDAVIDLRDGVVNHGVVRDEAAIADS